MTEAKEYIWYASYGSNILEKRFLCYILGGQPEGSKKNYPGCQDKSLPIDKEEIYINSELYFARKSEPWNYGGVAFIQTDFEPQASTLGRMYLITKEQFVEVVKQETANGNELNMDFEKVISEGSLIIKDKSWYGNIIYLGPQKGYPIFTFTNADNIQAPNKPDEHYLKTIIRGLQETYDLNAIEIANYLISKQGIAGSFSQDDLIKIIDDKKN